MSPAAKSEEKRMFSQAKVCLIGKLWKWEKKILQLNLKFELQDNFNGTILMYTVGCFCVYGSLESLDFVRDCLDELSVKSKYDSVDESNPILILPPTFIILARSPNNEDIIHHLRKEGQELCSRYGWPVLLRFLPYSIRPKFCFLFSCFSGVICCE